MHAAKTLACLVLLLFAAGCGAGTAGMPCTAATECSDGQICSNGTCAGCAEDAQCAELGASAACIDSACDACPNGRDSCACDAGACESGLVCEGATATCRLPASCADFGCAANQACEWSQFGSGTGCLMSCDPGYTWNGNTCDFDPRTCNAASDPTSILAQCDLENRECEVIGMGAQCGACRTGFADDGTNCVPEVFCSSLGCAAQNRVCMGEPLATCTFCQPGFIDNAMGNCVPATPCSALTCNSSQLCVEAEDSDGDGFLDVDARCVDASDCASQSAIPNPAQMGACISCSLCLSAVGVDTSAMPMWEPVPSGGGVCVCKTLHQFFFTESAGVGVRPCDADGDGWVRQTARASIESSDPVIAANARCVVHQMTDLALDNDPGTISGGTRQSLVLPVSDPLLMGASASSLNLYEPDTLDDQLLLQGVQNNPGDSSLINTYGTGRALDAVELNSLTKVCLTLNADFNQNSVADLVETHEDTVNLGASPFAPYASFSFFLELHRGYFEPDSPLEVLDTTMGAFYRVGRYHVEERTRAAAASAGQGLALTYDASDAYAAGDHHQTCTRYRDPAVGGSDHSTLDLARFTDPDPSTFVGMNHHSQYKCARLVATPGENTFNYTVEASEIWDGLSGAAPGVDQYQWNNCDAGATTHPSGTPNADNPSDPELTCSRPATIAQPVGWIIRRYLNDSKPRVDHLEDADSAEPTYMSYRGGCINECVNQDALPPMYQCPGYKCPACAASSTQSPGHSCNDDAGNFGRLECGCAPNYGGALCEVGCPDARLHTDPGFTLGSRNGYWMCGNLTATEGVALEQNPGSSSGYVLRGEIPVDPPAVMPLQNTQETGDVYGLTSTGCDDADPMTPCYTLRQQ